MDESRYRLSANVMKLVPGYLPDAGKIQHFIRVADEVLAGIEAPDYTAICGNPGIRGLLGESCHQARAELERYASDLGLVADPDPSRFAAERPSGAPAEKGICIPVVEDSSNPAKPPLMICQGSGHWVMLAEPEGP